MEDETAACAAENGAAGENLGANGGGLAIARQPGCTFKLREQVEEQQDGAKRRFGGDELFQAEAIGSQVVLQFRDAIFHVGTPVVVAPDIFGSMGQASNEDAEGVAGYVDQFAAWTIAAFAHPLADDHEAPLGAPGMQAQPELARCKMLVQIPPLLHTLGGAFDPFRQAGHYNVGDLPLFQKTQQ